MKRTVESSVLLKRVAQSYYNVDESDLLCQQTELDMLATVFEPLNDLVDVGMCTGSGFVCRRSALNSIGGWPLLDAGEDVMCSALLVNAGWKSAFVREDSQVGLACESLFAHIKQRMRWVRFPDCWRMDMEMQVRC